MSEWTDAIVGERMTVDNQFNERVTASRFSSQEWGLIMTATEFEIEHSDDPEAARLVADTSNLPAIMPELENVRSQVAAMGGGGGDAGGSDGGIVGSILGALGLGGDADGASDGTTTRPWSRSRMPTSVGPSSGLPGACWPVRSTASSRFPAHRRLARTPTTSQTLS